MSIDNNYIAFASGAFAGYSISSIWTNFLRYDYRKRLDQDGTVKFEEIAKLRKEYGIDRADRILRALRREVKRNVRNGSLTLNPIQYRAPKIKVMFSTLFAGFIAYTLWNWLFPKPTPK